MQAEPVARTDSEVALERFLAKPPGLSEVLQDAMLYQVFYWFMVSRFAPENLMFRSAVVQYQEAVRSGDTNEAREKVRFVESRYLGDKAAFEVNRQVSNKCLAELPDEELKEDLFASVLELIDRDLGRALQTLWASSVFKVFVKHRAMIDAVNARAPPVHAALLGTMRAPAGGGSAAAQVQAQVRAAFGSATPLRMKRHYEVGSPYPYRLTRRDNDEAVVGFARQNGEVFAFFNLQEKEVLQVEAVALLGRQSVPAQAQPDSDDEPGSGCCSPARSRSSTRDSVQLPAKTGWFVNDFGPIPYSEMQLLWKFRLLPEEAMVRQGSLEPAPIKQQITHFSPASQVQLVDPTVLEEHGDMAV